MNITTALPFYDNVVKTALIMESWNICDNSKNESGFIDKSNGEVIAHETYYHTDYLPIRNGQKYALYNYNGTYFAMYDRVGKKYIQNNQSVVDALSGELINSWLVFKADFDGYIRFTIANGSVNCVLIPVANNDWASEHMTTASYLYKAEAYIPRIGFDIDDTLSKDGDAADAKATGDAINIIRSEVGNKSVYTEYTFSRVSGGGYYWNNDVTIALKKDDTVYVSIISYDGTKFSRLRIFGVNGESATELGSTNAIGSIISITPSVDYEKIRYMIVQTELENPVSAVCSFNKKDTGVYASLVEVTNNIYTSEEKSYSIVSSKPYNLIKSDLVWTEHAYVNRGDGSITNVIDSESEYYSNCASDYIEIEPSNEYICNYYTTQREIYDEATDTHIAGTVSPFNRMMFAFYTAEKAFVATSSEASATSKVIPQTAKYIRVTISDKSLIPFARLIYGNYVDRPNLRMVNYRELHRKTYYQSNSGFERLKMVLFGDSITAGPASGFCIADYASDYLNSNIISVGFGGTRMTYDLVGSGLFCFYNLCQCIVSDNPSVWYDLDAYVENMESTIKPNYELHLSTLKAMDWESVNAIGIMYGANDYSSNTPVGSDFNTLLENYDGACAYGIKLLLEKYPHLQVVLFKPFFGLTIMGDYDSGMDVIPNTAGLYIQDYGESLYNVQKGLHIPVVDTMQELGINKYNLKYYSYDGLHPRTQQALYRLGHQWANIIKRYVSPY